MRIIEGEYDDRPLQGPWSRRRENPPVPAGNIPDTGGGMYGSEGDSEDRPLQGPWNRRREPEPVAVEADPEERPAPPEKEREKERVRVDREPLPGRPAEVQGPAGGVPDAEKTVPVRCYPVPERERVLIRNMFCPPGLYMGVVMAEILCGRGGRYRRR